MSGTSLDGLDVVSVHFYFEEQRWKYRINKAETLSYPQALSEQLSEAHTLLAQALVALDCTYGRYLGEQVRQFIQGLPRPDFIASHGHTILHRPELGYTLQIGHGAYLAQAAGLPVIADFRSADVAVGGQGAPLVPMGEQLLFPEFSAFVNLGGFANASIFTKQTVTAFDIVPCNVVLNTLCSRIGLSYDDGGQVAASGSLIQDLNLALNELTFYAQLPPKSLGREWVEQHIWPILNRYSDCRIPDILNTFCHHIAAQVNLAFKRIFPAVDSVLFTGGGVFNTFLMEQIRQYGLGRAVAIPDEQTIIFKEALIFAFLGLLYMLDSPNCLPSVTGASRPVIGGALYKY
jgi:anhydro-N-acetylmuramic acid kinase